MKLRSGSNRIIREYRCSVEGCPAVIRIQTDWSRHALVPPEWYAYIGGRFHTRDWHKLAPMPAEAASWERDLGHCFCPEHAPSLRSYQKEMSSWWASHRAAQKDWWLNRVLPCIPFMTEDMKHALRFRFDTPKPKPPWEDSDVG